MQLHYLYVQCKDMVVSGSLPTSYEEACQLAGLQLQIDYGNFVPENHRYGWFQERLDQISCFQHGRMKNFDKDVLTYWKQVTGMQQLNGKYRYVQLVRSLKTFGITCFEVEEKAPKGFRKILLGVAAERIYRMDLNTKETLSQHSITHLRRFAAGPKTITLDFADYEQDYSTFKTDRSEEILQLISGYIDIYLKKRQSVGIVVKDDDAESAEVSEVAPVVGFASTTYTSSVGVDQNALLIGEATRFTSAGVRPSYNAQIPGAAEVQGRPNYRKSVYGSAAEKVEANTELMRELDPFLDLLAFGDQDLPRSALGDEDFRKALGESLGLAVAQAEEWQAMLKNNPDKTAQGHKQTQLLHSLADLMRNARLAAAESEEDISLLDGAKHLASAITRMLQTQKMYGPDDPRSIEAAKNVQAARAALMAAMDKQQVADKASRDMVTALAGQVAAAVKRLEDAAKAAALPDDVTRLQARRDNFNAQVEILAPISASETGRPMLDAAARSVVTDAELTKKNAAKVQDPAAQKNVQALSDEVAVTVGTFLAAIACTSAQDDADPTAQADIVNAGLEQIKESRGDRGGLQRGTRDVIVAASKIVRAFTADAERLEPEEKAAVLERVATLTALLKVEGSLSKESVAKLSDPAAHEALVANGRQLRDAVEQLLGEGAATVAAKNLQNTAKRALAATSALAVRAREAALNSNDPAAAAKMQARAAGTTAALPPLVDAIRKSNAAPNDTPTLLALANTSRRTAPVAAVLVADSAGFVHKVKDVSTKAKLKADSEATYEAVEAMVKAAEQVSAAVGARALEDATNRSAGAQAQLEALLLVARDGVLPPPSGSLSDARSAMALAADNLKQLVNTLRNPGPMSPAELRQTVGATTGAILELTQACARLAPHQPRAAQPILVDNVRAVVAAVKVELAAVSTVLANPAAQPTLTAAADKAVAAIDKLQDGTRSSAALTSEFEKTAKGLAAPADAPATFVTFAMGVEELDSRAKTVAAALARVATDSHGDDEQLMGALRSLQSAWRVFRNTAVGVANAAPAGSAATIDNGVRGIAVGAFKVLEATRVGHQTGKHEQDDAALQIATGAVRQLLSDARGLSPENQGFAVALSAMTQALAALQAGTLSPGRDAQALDDPIKALNDNLRDLAAAMDRAATSTSPDDALNIAKSAGAALDRTLIALSLILKSTPDPKLAEALRQSSVALGNATIGVVQQLQNAASKQRDAATQAQLIEGSERVTEAIQKLRDLVPGQRECDAAVLSAHASLATLDRAILSSAAGVLPHSSVPLHSAEENVIAVLMKLSVASAGISSTVARPLQMVPHVAQLGDAAQQLGAASMELAAASDASAQQDRLARAKNIAARSLAVAKAARTCRNDSSAQLRASLAQASKDLSDDLRRLLGALQDEVGGLRLCDDASAAINAAAQSLRAPVQPAQGSYQEARAAIEAHTKVLMANVASSLLEGAKGDNTVQIAQACVALGQGTGELATKLRKAASVTSDGPVRGRIVESGAAFTTKAAGLVAASKAFLEAPKNEEIRSQLSAAFQTVASATADVLTAVREGATGEIDCTAAIAETRDVTSALDEAILFSATGGLKAAVDPAKTLHFYYQGLQDDLAALANTADRIGTKASIEELGALSRRAAKLTSNMRDNGVACAYLVESLPAQQAMLTETRSLAGSVLTLLTEARDNQLSGAPPPASAAAIKAKVAALQACVTKEAGAQLVRLTEIDNAEKKVKGGIAVLDTETQPGNAAATAEDIVRAIRVVVASYTVVSNESADDAARLKAVKDLGQASQELLVNTKGALRLTADTTLRRALTGGAKKLGTDTLALLSQTAHIEDTTESLKAINTDITELVASVRKLPGGEDLSLEENDLERQAELELQKAAQQIQEAAERIANARERVKTDEDYKGMSLADQDIAAAILDAAKAIARATGVLVIAATASQKELLQKGKANKALNPYRKDPAWANGYISSAKTVSATIEELVQVANDAAKKKVGNEHLVAASRAVAGATARFVYASKVKSDPSSPTTQKLEEASKATASATLALVNAAKEASRRADEHAFKVQLDEGKDAAQQLRKMEFELQVEIATLEKELEEARRRLAELRKSEYLKDAQPMTINRSVGEAPVRSAGSLRRIQASQAATLAHAQSKEAKAEALAARLGAQAAPPASALPPPAAKLPPPRV